MKKFILYTALLFALTTLTSCVEEKPPETAKTPDEALQTVEAAVPIPDPDFDLVEFLPETGNSFNAAENLIALIIEDSDDLLIKAAMHGFLRTAENMGYPSLLIKTGSGLTPASALDYAKDKGVKGLVLWMSDSQTQAVAVEAQAAGITVVVPFFAYDGEVGANLAIDPVDFSTEAARQMCEEAKKRGNVTGKILIIGSETQTAISDAFTAAATALYPQYEIIAGAGKRSPADFLNTNKDTIGILALSDGTPQEWIDAYNEVKKTAKPTPTPKPSSKKKADATPAPAVSPTPKPTFNPVIIGLDYTEKNIKSVDDAEIFAFIGRPYFDSTAQAIATLDRLLRGMPTQVDVRLNAPIVRKSGVEKYKILTAEVKEWFKE